MKWLNKNYVQITITTLIVALVTAISLHNQTYNNCHTPNKNDGMDGSFLTCPISQNVERVTANTNQGKTQEQKKQELQIADHEAQIDMAWYAKIGVLLGLFGSVLLYWTLSYTRDAASAASKTLDVARDTLAEAKNATRRELRAYIYCHPPNITRIHDFCCDPSKLDLTFEFEIENKGQTPAYGVQAGFLLYFTKTANGGPTGDNKHFNIGNFTQLHKGDPIPKKIEVEIDHTALVANGEYIKPLYLGVLVLIQYHDIYSVTGNLDRERFTDTFMNTISLPTRGGAMVPQLIKEPDKKTA